ncbi:MAG: rane protein, partial [Actinomycetota bacterium]
MPNTKQEQKEQPRSGLDVLLAPVMAAALFVVAMIQSLRTQRRDDPEPSPAPADAEPEERGLKAKLSRLPVIGGVLKVQKRYGELKGSNLAAAVAFQTFLSLFPLLLVIVAVVGFFASKDSTVGTRIIGNLGLQGEAARTVSEAIDTAAKNPTATGPIGLAGLLWSGLGLV